MKIMFYHNLGEGEYPHVPHDLAFDGDCVSETTKAHKVVHVDVDSTEFTTVYTAPEEQIVEDGECWYITLTAEEMHLICRTYLASLVAVER